MVTGLVGGRTDFGTSDLSFWANLAASAVAKATRHQSLESTTVSSTTSSTETLALPSNFGYALSLSNLSLAAMQPGRELLPTSIENIDSRETYLGIPEKWAVYGNEIRLWPSCDSAYSIQIRYQTKEGTIVASTATPSFDEKYHLAWVYKTAEIAASMRNDTDNEALNRARYLSEMGATLNDLGAKQQARNIRLQPRPW